LLTVDGFAVGPQLGIKGYGIRESTLNKKLYGINLYVHAQQSSPLAPLELTKPIRVSFSPGSAFTFILGAAMIFCSKDGQK